MHASRVLQFLSIPAALGLGTAVILACSDGGPTAPGDQVSAVQPGTPFAAPSKGGTYRDNRVSGDPSSCQNGYSETDSVNSPETDVNGDGTICYKPPKSKK